MKDLTTSDIERQNVLNNRFAVDEMQRRLGIEGMLFEGEYRFTKKMVADFYGVDISTINRYLTAYGNELKRNGYVLCQGKSLAAFKLQFDHLTNEAIKIRRLGLFNFRALLNIGMLLAESEKAKSVRSLILDVVIATINERTGGGTKYMNYITAAITEEYYRENLTSAIKRYVFGHPTYKYAQVTDLIYEAVFGEKAKEYRKILRLAPKDKDNVRQTLYAEVLLVISSFENGLAAYIEACFEENEGVPLTIEDVAELIDELSEHPMQKPYIHDARTKMASRDYSFRDAYHGNIADYLRAVTPEEFERFIGDQSVDFDQILAENKDVLKRLKQAEDE